MGTPDDRRHMATRAFDRSNNRPTIPRVINRSPTRARRRWRYSSSVGLSVPAAERKGTKGEGPSDWLHRRFPRKRYVWGTRQSRWLRTADGFAVLSAIVGLCILTWIKDADSGPVVGIMSRAFRQRTRLFSFLNDLGPPVWWPYFFLAGNGRKASKRDGCHGSPCPVSGPDRASNRQTQAPSTTLNASQIRRSVIFGHPPGLGNR
jgi:hypothetical protein